MACYCRTASANLRFVLAIQKNSLPAPGLAGVHFTPGAQIAHCPLMGVAKMGLGAGELFFPHQALLPLHSEG
jgi:hypothetical protein